MRMACQRHLIDRELAAREGGHPRGWWFDPDAADYVFEFFEEVLRLPDTMDENGDPKPFKLEPAQDFIVGSIFGWKGRSGYRRFREAYIEIGKGNGKTPLFAGIGLYGLTEDEELAAEIYAAATDRRQAEILFRDAERMVRCSPDLAARLEMTVGNIADPSSMSFFRPFSRDQGVKSGPRPHMGLIDELHEHPSGEITVKIRAGAKGRRQPFFGEITNSGFDRTSICWAHHEHSRLVLEAAVEGRVLDDQWFAYVCALDEGDDPLTDPSCWIKANPLLGVSITEDYLARQVQNAKNIPAEENTVRRLNFCQWTQQNERLIPIAEWNACGAVVHDQALDGLPCYAGLDLGQTDDFSAFVLLWIDQNGRYIVRPRFWIPKAAMELYPHRPYQVWLRSGLIEVTDGNITDYNVIEDAVADECRRWSVREVAYDKRFAQQMALNLQGHGLTMVDTPQGFHLTEAIKKLGELVASRNLSHGGHAVLSWMAGNVEGRHGRDGQIRIDKETSGDKIDGISALVMALSRAIVQPVKSESVYASRGLRTVGGG